MDTKTSTLFIALRLTVICFVAVLLLGIINALTAPNIEKNKIKAENEAIKILMPNGIPSPKKYFSKLPEELQKSYYYYEITNNNNIVGYIVSSESKGYGGTLKVMVAFDNDLKIINAKLLDNAETPGLGKKAENQDYMKKFIGTNTPDKPFPKNKNDLPPADKDSVTGATITFNGITGAISKAIEYLRNEKK